MLCYSQDRFWSMIVKQIKMNYHGQPSRCIKPGEKYQTLLIKLYLLHSYEDDFKLDGVGPVDNRPSTNNLPPFVRKKLKIKRMFHVSRDM